MDLDSLALIKTIILSHTLTVKLLLYSHIQGNNQSELQAYRVSNCPAGHIVFTSNSEND